MKIFLAITMILAIACNSANNKDSDKDSKESSSSNAAKSNSRWTNEDQVTFMDDCIAEAQKKLKGDSAQIYCACMLKKVQSAYPVFSDVSKKMTVDEVEKWADECMGK